ncbi:MAG: type III restriction-modification system endonuclease, partial [Planctomycetaceae bacterium]|nr:type III restriction-modification system endonuclease [Planctomycetaceae bacterium]
DQILFGSNSCPVDGVKDTRPVVLIDEPHRIGRESKAYKIISEKMNPQLIVRFGATFPESSEGTGKNKITKKDFYRGAPIFDLGAVESFNQGLVKAVDVFFANLDESNALNKFRVENITARKLTLKKERKIFEINIGEPLPPEFEGNLTYEGGNDKKLSNDLELKEGMDLTTSVFSNSYQEILLSQAIDAHFEKEEENFFRNNNRPKVKTIALFFIDSIKSYRDKDGWLKETLEKLLNKKLNKLLKKYADKTNDRETEYYDFLQATKTSLASEQQDVHAGYFAEDRGKGDEAIQTEVQDILSNKEKMLSFKNENGQWNTRRFLFSKWTLREGWDNPNVFTICKLRTSGSETSKIQEVGRGLRLPVDELGNRLSGEEFRLNYIIGWDEKDFAEKLIGEINRDAKIILNNKTLTDEMMKLIADSRKISGVELLEILDKKNIIDRSNHFKENGYEKLLQEYPELLQTQLERNKVTSPSIKNKRAKIKLRIDNWKKIAEFWELISKRYMISFERLSENDWEDLVRAVLNENIFYSNSINIKKYSTEKNIDADSGMSNVKMTEQNIPVNLKTDLGVLHYGEFIRKLHGRTCIPVSILHRNIRRKFKELSKQKSVEEINSFLNENSLDEFFKRFTIKFEELFSAKYKYVSLDFSAETSIKKDGSFVTELERGLVGVYDASDIQDDPRNLYDLPLSYDSEIEHEVLKIKAPQRVIVYGKLPKGGVKLPLPTYTGVTTSPDFVYAIRNEKTNGVELHLIIETKSDNLRQSDKTAIKSQEKFFKTISSSINWKMETDIRQIEYDLKQLAGN